MDRERRKSCESKANIFKVFAHPTRVFILEELAEKERCVCEITALVGNDITTISKHLSIMKTAGIVGSYKEKNRVFYYLEKPCAIGFLDCVNEAQNNKLKSFQAV